MRLFRNLASLAVCMVIFGAAVAAIAANPLIIKTADGKIRGKDSSDGRIRIFLGIPYAAPPVGKLRWQPPQPEKKWSGTRDATQFGFRCMQPNVFEDMRFRDPGQSENCLTLNVWTPAHDDKASLPVMVWIYGGGFLGGATSEPRQDGEHLAHRNVVVVSMNYRLGLFGFFVNAGLAAESPHHAAGNYGLMDQTAALQWVKRNIRQFGGDPDNITLFGESAGSFSVSEQMASPLARGLLAHAIGESGAAFDSQTLRLHTLSERETMDSEYAKATFGTSDLAALRAMSAEDLLQKMEAARGADQFRFAPDIDGWFLPQRVAQIYREGRQAHIPLLAGWNRDEPSALDVTKPQPPTVSSFRALAEKEFGSEAPAFLRVYPAETDAEAVRSAIDFAGDRFIAFSTWSWLEAQANTDDIPVYEYHFERPAPVSRYAPAGSGAFHSDEIEYVFGTLDSRVGAVWQPADYKLSDLIEDYWTSFARTGNPNAPGLPEWPRYNAGDSWHVMHLDADSHAGPDTRRDRYLFLRSVWAAK